jgi:hypothetical protein
MNVLLTKHIKKLLFLTLSLILLLLTSCSYINFQNVHQNNNVKDSSFINSTIPEIVHASIGKISIWSYTEIKNDIYKHSIYPVKPTAIYITDNNVFNLNNAKKIVELPLSITKKGIKDPIYVRVINITPANNNWIVVEEYLSGKNWNQGYEKLIGIDIDSKKQIDIAEGPNTGGSFFNYIVFGKYVVYNLKSLSSDSINTISKTSILNIDNGKIENLPTVIYNSQTEPNKAKSDNSKFEIKDNTLFINGIKFIPNI